MNCFQLYLSELNWIKLLIYFLLFLVIYSYSFYKVGNTLYRKNSNNIYEFSIIPLFTEGFIGPIRGIYFLLLDYNFYGSFIILRIILTSLWSPYAVILLLYLVNYIQQLYLEYIHIRL